MTKTNKTLIQVFGCIVIFIIICLIFFNSTTLTKAKLEPINNKTLVYEASEDALVKGVCEELGLDYETLGEVKESSYKNNTKTIKYNKYTIKIENYKTNTLKEQDIVFNVVPNDKLKEEIQYYNETQDFNIEQPQAYKFKIKLKDVEAPVIAFKKETVEINEDAAVIPEDYITLSDNVDSKPTLTYRNPVVSSTPGTYYITYTATDKSKNTTSKVLTVNVIGKPTPKVVVDTTITASAPTYNYNVAFSNNSNKSMAMFENFNAYRASNGLGPLTYDYGGLQSAVNTRMAEEQYSDFNHYRPNGTYYMSIFSQYGLGTYGSEIMAWNSSSDTACLNFWMNSAPHRGTILGSRTRVAIAYAYTNGAHKYIALFY